MLDVCISLLKDSVYLLVKSKEMKSENKMRVSILLGEMSSILEDTANKISKNEYPHFNCALMEKMSNHLHFQLKDFIPEVQLNELHKSLIEASMVEKQFVNREDGETIPSIFNAAATFKTFSLLLKI
jgi:hypothetical protein